MLVIFNDARLSSLQGSSFLMFFMTKDNTIRHFLDHIKMERFRAQRLVNSRPSRVAEKMTEVAEMFSAVFVF